MSRKIASLYAEIGANTSGLQQGLAQSRTMLGETGNLMRSLGIPALTLTSVIALGREIKNVADNTMNYGIQVRDFMRALGTSAEQASTVIQVADDAGIAVENLTTSMRLAQQHGINPTIEGLSQLADQYLAIQDPAARATFLTDTFGRSGQTMGRLLEEGSAGVLAMAEAVQSSGLILDQRAVDQAEAYRVATDNLTDSWTAFRNEIGASILPTLANLFQELADYIAVLRGADEQTKTSMEQELRWIETYLDAGIVSQDLARRHAQLEIQLAALDSQNGITAISTDGVTEAMQAQQDAVGLVSDSFGELTRQQLFNIASQNLDSESALRLARSMGILNEETYAIRSVFSDLDGQIANGAITMQTGADAAEALATYINSLQSRDVTITITTIERYVRESWAFAGGATVDEAAARVFHWGSNTTARANGGYVNAGQAYMVGERGPEPFIPAQSGYIAPTDADLLTNSSMERLFDKFATTMRDLVLSAQA